MFYVILILLMLFTLISTLMVIISKNPIHSILYLVLTFVNSAILLVLINIEFLAMLFLVVYVGAIAILFLFVVMMLNIKIMEFNERILSYIPMGGLIGLLFLSELLYIVVKYLLPEQLLKIQDYQYICFSSLYENYWNLILNFTNIEYISALLYIEYVYLFIISGMILLVAMIGAIILTLNIVTLIQSPYIQINRKLNNVIQYIK